MNTEHDRATKVADNRIDQHLPIVRRNRHNLSNLVIVPKPPATPHEPPREFRYIEPTQEEIDQAQPSPRQPTPQPSKPSKKEAKPRTPTPPPTPPPAPKTIKRIGDKIPDKDEEKLQNAVKVFNEPLVVKVCYSKVVKEKSEAIEDLKNQVASYSKDKAKPGQFYKATSEVLQFLLKTSIWSCFQEGCNITVSLMENVVEKNK